MPSFSAVRMLILRNLAEKRNVQNLTCSAALVPANDSTCEVTSITRN